jgi:glycosyltransferase involved in cell wall biosynthesis
MNPDKGAAASASRPVVSVVVPTVGRADYLEVALQSLRAQDVQAPFEVIVVDDGSTDRTSAVVSRAGVRVVRHASRRRLNAGRNSGIRAARSDLIAFVDDDVWAPPGWLRALLEGAARYPEALVFAGPIRPRLEGREPRGCGRDAPLITSLDLGPGDLPTDRAWGANLAVRRAAVARAGYFDESFAEPCGDEEEWLMRLREAGGRIVYLGAAGLDHRRSPEDSRFRSLARAGFKRGQAGRANDRRRGVQPGLRRELRILVGCGWHTVRRTCPQGVIMTVHSAGRVFAALRER